MKEKSVLTESIEQYLLEKPKYITYYGIIIKQNDKDVILHQKTKIEIEGGFTYENRG